MRKPRKTEIAAKKREPNKNQGRFNLLCKTQWALQLVIFHHRTTDFPVDLL